MSLTTTQLIIDKSRILAEYYTCQSKILKNQEYTIKDRTYKRADLKAVQLEIRRLQADLIRFERGGIRVRRLLPHDG